MNQKLLIIACSQRKVHTKGKLPAIDRYDGGSARIIRKARRDGYFPPNIDIKILSAKFGLIGELEPIEDYEQKMDKKRAMELREQVQEELQKCLGGTNYSEIYIDLGQEYMPAVEGFEKLYDVKVVQAEGQIGERLHQLKYWLLPETFQQTLL